jgi:hypothetical protein
MGDRSIPETLVSPVELYAAMRQGMKVTTAQASTFERHQRYESLLLRHDQVVYLCVGSVYTGNYDVARHWAAGHATGHRFTVIDTAAAAGKPFRKSSRLLSSMTARRMRLTKTFDRFRESESCGTPSTRAKGPPL